MIDLPQMIAEALEEKGSQAFYLVYIQPDIYLTSLYRDITLTGRLYLSDGRLLSVSPPQVASDTGKQSFKISLADAGKSITSALSLQYMNKEVEVRIGVVGIDGLLPTNLSQTLLIYSGGIDTFGTSTDPSEIGSVSVEIEGASPMMDLEKTTPYYASQDYLDKIHPGDVSFIQAQEGSGQISLRWGKA